MSVTTFRIEPASIATAPVPFLGTAASTGKTRHFPSLTTTVPKELVHRASVAEVLLTDWAREDDAHFSVTAQWSRGHSFFTAVQGRHDPLIAAETFRQAAILLAHAEFGVPLENHFLMRNLTVDVHPEHLGIGTAPASIDIEMSCQDITWRRGTLAGVRFEAVFRRGGQIVATASGACTCTTPAVYRRLRGEQLAAAEHRLPLTAPTAPQNVGRTSAIDVVLSPTKEPRRWLLRTDTRHPVLFDHQVDHVPGMVLLEAARQATVAALGQAAFPRHMASEFKRYVELDAPCVVETCRLPDDHAGGGRVLVTAHQEGSLMFSATVGADLQLS